MRLGVRLVKLVWRLSQEGVEPSTAASLRGSLHPRLALTYALLPLAVGVFTLAVGGIILAERTLWQTSYSTSQPTAAFSLLRWLIGLLIVGMTMIPLVVGYLGGYLIWRKTVRWSPGKRRALLFTTCGVLLAHSIGPALFILSRDEEAALIGFIPNLISLTIALPLLCWLCWSPPGGRSEDVDARCRECDYDMRGQTECRCPECGAMHTIGELVRNDRMTPPLGCTLR